MQKVFISPDNWNIGVNLEPSEWSRAQAYLPSAKYTDVTSAVNIKVTGRTCQYRGGVAWIRVQIEFVHDDEPSTFHGGWLLASDLEALEAVQAEHANRCATEPIDLFGCFTTQELIDRFNEACR